MNTLTQYQLSYIARFIPQYEQGILNFICCKFNDTKFKISVYKIKNNERLLKWYCDNFGFNYDELVKISDMDDNFEFIKWMIKNNLFFDFKIAINDTANNSWTLKRDLSKYLIEHDLVKYVELVFKSKYIDYTILITQTYSIHVHKMNLGLIPYCIYNNYNDMLDYVIKVIPKKYIEFYYSYAFGYSPCNDYVDSMFNLAFSGYFRLENENKKLCGDFMKKHSLCFD